MLQRMMAAASLDSRVYEEVEADQRATFQAMIVVVLVGLATGIGIVGIGGHPVYLIFGVIDGVLSWAIWAFITYKLGTTLFRTPETEANWGQLARTTGFAQSPGVLRIFGFIPGVGVVIFYAAILWQLAAMVVAVRQALDYRSTARALGVVIVGFAVLVVINAILARLI